MNKHAGKYQPKTSFWWGKGLSKFPSEYIWSRGMAKTCQLIETWCGKTSLPFRGQKCQPETCLWWWKHPPIKKYNQVAFTSQRRYLSCALSITSPPSYFPASHNICCKHCVPPSDLVFDEENVLPISHPSTIKRYAFAPQRHLVSHCSLGRRPDL